MSVVTGDGVLGPRVESEERIRCEIMNALAAAAALTDRATPLPVVLAPIRAAPNPFLTPRLASDPPLPWANRSARSTRRRSAVPFVTLALALAIALGLAADSGARLRSASAMRASAKTASAHLSKMFFRRGH